jgi:hypothetical protein
LRREHRQREFENRLLKKISETERMEVIKGFWRKLYNGELHDTYIPSHSIRVMKSGRVRWAWHAARFGGEEKCIRVLVGKSEGSIPLGTLGIDGRSMTK